MSLCRHFVRELRRSVLVGTPEPDKSSKRSSAILDGLGDMNHPAAGPSMYATEKERDQDAQMSAFLREERADARESPPSSDHRPGRPSPGTHTPHDMTDSNSPAHTVARQDIRASAEKILYTFLLPGAEREITLPGSITQDVTTAIEEFGRDDPEVFDVAKDYVFQAMERDAFPGFLRMKALGNLIPPTLIMRLILGLLAMFGAFWTAFVLIFLDEARITRLWVRFFFVECYERKTMLIHATSAHPTLHDWGVLPCLIPVFPGPHSGFDWAERVYTVQLFMDSRAICAKASRTARHHGACRHHVHRCRIARPLHSCTRQAPLNQV